MVPTWNIVAMVTEVMAMGMDMDINNDLEKYSSTLKFLQQ